MRLRADGGEQVRDAVGEDARLAGAGAGDTSSGPSVVSTASRWAGFRSARYVSGVVAATDRS